MAEDGRNGVGRGEGKLQYWGNGLTGEGGWMGLGEEEAVCSWELVRIWNRGFTYRLQNLNLDSGIYIKYLVFRKDAPENLTYLTYIYIYICSYSLNLIFTNHNFLFFVFTPIAFILKNEWQIPFRNIMTPECWLTLCCGKVRSVC